MKLKESLLILFLLLTPIITFKCGANDIKDVKINKVSQPDYKRRLSSFYTPIQIKMDYSYLDSQKNSDPTTISRLKKVLNKTITYFSKLLSVYHSDFFYQPEHFKTYCKIPVFGEDYGTWGLEYDLVIVPYFSDSIGTSIQAAATACVAISETMQPKMGVIMINPNLDFSYTNSERFLEMLFLHEMSHVLIFHQAFFFSLNLMTQEIKNDETVYYIKSPTVLEKAKLHFGCNSITGIPLENYGGAGSAGSHWESRYLLGDYMIATDYPEIVISDISLAVFEDSGFYKVNYYSGGLFKFGKNKGCDFFNKKCIEKEKAIFDEFCDVKDRPKCSSSRTIKSSCFLYDYELPKKYQYFSDSNKGGFIPANYCPVALELSNPNDYFPNHCQFGISLLAKEYGEKIGENSFCFISSLLPDNSKKDNSPVSICYEVECDTKNKNIIVKIGSKRVICPSNGGSQTPDGFKGSIECPKYNDICSFNDNIMCNEMFNCLKVLSKNDFDELSYYDYEGNAIYLDEYSYYFDDFDPFIPNESLSVSTNLALFFLVYLILFIN